MYEIKRNEIVYLVLLNYDLDITMGVKYLHFNQECN